MTVCKEYVMKALLLVVLMLVLALPLSQMLPPPECDLLGNCYSIKGLGK